MTVNDDHLPAWLIAMRDHHAAVEIERREATARVRADYETTQATRAAAPVVEPAPPVKPRIRLRLFGKPNHA